MAGLVDLNGKELTVPRQRTATSTPPQISQALNRQGMNTSGSMGPGTPQRPRTGYSVEPRSTDYPIGVNLATQSRSAWGRTSYDVMKAIIDAYDVARMCINHKIDELRSMEPMFLPADGVTGDVSAAIDAARTVMAFPDRESPFDSWVAMLLESALRYDAPALYKRRNYNGEIISYEVLDGTTILPYIDEYGRRPQPPAPAYFQRIQGMTDTWFTREDITYVPFRPQADSPYGLAPIESILLTANTDLRFQWHFLQMFTEGTIPGGFINLPPDISSPDQVEEWQEYWDAFTLGDQSILHKLTVVPNGTTVTETRPKTFDKDFPQYLIKRTAGAFGVVPQDLGLVEDVNRANGETQTDIQFRINTLPWVRWLEGIVSRYLQIDLGLPVAVKLDTGRDKEDRLAEAQAWQVYIETGMASPDEGRQELLGLEVDNDRPIPRGIISSRVGFIPFNSVLAVSGPVDSETGAPTGDAPLPTQGFDGTPGLIPDKQPGGTQFKRAPINHDNPLHPEDEGPVPGTDVVGGPTEPAADEEVAKSAADESAELAQFRRFAKAAQRRGKWRDFQFTVVDGVHAHRLNDAARAELRKAAGEVIAAGLAVRALDTGRVLMLQRGLDLDDPASGAWEFPGGHIEDGEQPFDAACREWQEEVGILLPAVATADAYAQFTSWAASNGVYVGFVFDVGSEADIALADRAVVTNPDDPDGDIVEAVAWWAPSLIVGNPAIREELLDDAPVVLAALNGTESYTEGEVLAPAEESVSDLVEENGLGILDEIPEPIADAAVDAVDDLGKGSFERGFNARAELNGFPVRLDENRKPGEITIVVTDPEDDAGPLVKGWRDTSPLTPQHDYDLQITDHYTPAIRAAIVALINQVPVEQVINDAGGSALMKADADTIDTDQIAQQVRDRIAKYGDELDTDDLEQIIRQVIVDGYTAGGHAAGLQLSGHSVQIRGVTGTAIATTDWATWTPGDTAAALKTADGGLKALLDQSGVTIKGITRTTLDQIGNKIAAGLQAGDPTSKVAQGIRDLVDGSSWRADLIAHTETARAMTAAAMDVYNVNGIDEWDLLTTEGACEECIAIADQNPHPVSDDEDAPPVHGYCRCASAPRPNGQESAEPVAEDVSEE